MFPGRKWDSLETKENFSTETWSLALDFSRFLSVPSFASSNEIHRSVPFQSTLISVSQRVQPLKYFPFTGKPRFMKGTSTCQEQYVCRGSRTLRFLTYFVLYHPSSSHRLLSPQYVNGRGCCLQLLPRPALTSEEIPSYSSFAEKHVIFRLSINISPTISIPNVYYLYSNNEWTLYYRN